MHVLQEISKKLILKEFISRYFILWLFASFSHLSLSLSLSPPSVICSLRYTTPEPLVVNSYGVTSLVIDWGKSIYHMTMLFLAYEKVDLCHDPYFSIQCSSVAYDSVFMTTSCWLRHYWWGRHTLFSANRRLHFWKFSFLDFVSWREAVFVPVCCFCFLQFLLVPKKVIECVILF